MRLMRILIFGGAGFIGSNAARHFIQKNANVSVFDNLSREGTKSNLEWLKTIGNFDLIKGDIRNKDQVYDFIQSYPDATAILHLAAQVAVTTSVKDPRRDFEDNLLGTFNILEAIRENKKRFSSVPLLIYASTNKVYGCLSDIPAEEKNDHYAFKNSLSGVGENEPLDFYSPYGCSKGGADQYVLDYARIYGLPTTSFRQSCIYGYRQFGIEDQGWVAWFMIAALLNKKITVYGNGKQVRDLLFIDDLVAAYDLAIQNPSVVKGKAFNVGGGPKNTLSLLQFLTRLEDLCGKKINYQFSDWRPGDQPIYISNIRKIETELHWTPKTSVNIGLKNLYTWISQNRDLFL